MADTIVSNGVAYTDGQQVTIGGVTYNVDAGTAGSDNLAGGTGNDALFGGAGSDMLNGGAGADYLDGGSGIDRVMGGSGSDTLVYVASENQYRIGTTVIGNAASTTVFSGYDDYNGGSGTASNSVRTMTGSAEQDTLMLVLNSMEPEAMGMLWSTRLGWATLAVIAFCECMGVHLISKIVAIDV